MKKLLSTLALWTIYVPIAHAQDLGQGNLNAIGQQAYGQSTSMSLPVLIGTLIRVFIGVLGIIFLVLTVYAGFLYLTARGDKDTVQRAKDTLQRGVIGIIIILAAYAIATFVINALVATTSGAGA